ASPTGGGHTLMGRFVSATGQFLLATYGQFSCPPTGNFSCPLTLNIDAELLTHLGIPSGCFRTRM
ncbi:hypothetical protein, partial [Mycobacteroides chelonae]|uniref:hypothetical protein n=1 Tax=Mycobacteroides chelonae TaxID=1774 RepID=UPI001A96BDBD